MFTKHLPSYFQEKKMLEAILFQLTAWLCFAEPEMLKIKRV